ncbi:GNAT family N-acetyltransferase [Aliagarivorans taiwanensis]|uniref:GNAT family N-acetyltransferase n=1 Tax=Aliagarivorans taiwanensis TaxID=561966 RepID=UPI000402A6E9|nr:GNAT family N-acetyltransferase [Aliagarivorans taiwanensis]
MEIQVLDAEALSEIAPSVEAFLQQTFGEPLALDINSELLCAAVLREQAQLIGFGLAYLREMQQGDSVFSAGIIGSVAVAPAQRGWGYSKKLMDALEQQLCAAGADSAFLFAYQPAIYRSSGFEALEIPIRFFDKASGAPQQFVYRGGMVKLYSGSFSLSTETIEFNGCVY